MATGIKADGNIIIGTSVDVGGIDTGLYKINKSIKRFAKFAALSIGVKAFASLGKAALEAASDLQEVQNIVDVAFGRGTAQDMTSKIEAFSKTCIENFGMSELAAKQTAGSFMAMGKSMGLSMEEASDMAVKLTALSGDMSSFYNISQDYARVALSAVYTGETETLKRYGIILTEANLQQYANTIGIQESVKAMGSRDKALLRYKYILQATRDMEGDFVRTEATWANQTRVLKQVWNQLLITMGSGLISILTPVVKVLNTIIRRLITFTSAFWQILSKLFGFKMQDFNSQVSDTAGSAGDLADNTEDLADANKDATNSAKKLNEQLYKELGSFDKLNNLHSTSTTGDSDTGGTNNLDNLLGMEPINMSDYINTDLSEDPILVDNLYDLGRWIGDTICASLEAIDWNKVYEGAKNFGTGLADFLNGLISTDLFKDVGMTIAGCLNTAVYEALTFAVEFDWEQLGTKIAEGINEFFYDFDFYAFGQAIKYWAKGLWTLMATTIKEIDWGAVLKGIGEFFSGLGIDGFIAVAGLMALHFVLHGGIKKIVSSAVGTAFMEGLAEGLGLTALKDLILEKASVLGVTLGEAIIARLSLIFTPIQNFFVLLGNTISWFFKVTLPNLIRGAGPEAGAALEGPVTSAFGSIKASVVSAANAIADAFAGIGDAVGVFIGLLKGGNGLAASAEMAFGSVATTVAGVAGAIGGIALAVKEFIDMWSDGWDIISTILEALGIAIAAVAAVLLGVEALVAGIVAAVVFAISQLVILIHDNWDEICEWASNIPDWWKSNVVEPLKEFFSGLGDAISGFFSSAWDKISGVWSVVSGWFQENVVNPVKAKFLELFGPVIDAFSKIIEYVHGVFDTIKGVLISIWDAVSSLFTQIAERVEPFLEGIKILYDAFVMIVEQRINEIKEVVGEAIDLIKSNIEDKIDKIKFVFSVFYDWLDSKIIQPIKQIITEAIDLIKQRISERVEQVSAIFSAFYNWITTNIIQPIKEGFNLAITYIKDTFNNNINQIKSIFSTFYNWLNGSIIQPIRSAFNSLCSTIASGFSSAWAWVTGVWNGAVNWFTSTIIDPIRNAFAVCVFSIACFFSNLWDSITSGVKSAINGVIWAIESLLNHIVDGLNWFLSGFNSAVAGAAKLTGAKWSGITPISKVSIPRLAKGAVIPPNREFMAILGDQKSGTNIETPLATMIEAFNTALDSRGGGSDADIVIQIDGREVFRAVRNQNNDYIKRTGNSAFSY